METGVNKRDDVQGQEIIVCGDIGTTYTVVVKAEADAAALGQVRTRSSGVTRLAI
jgi:hypothetical protein